MTARTTLAIGCLSSCLLWLGCADEGSASGTGSGGTGAGGTGGGGTGGAGATGGGTMDGGTAGSGTGGSGISGGGTGGEGARGGTSGAGTAGGGATDGGTPPDPGLVLVGHSDLLARGMNAALAVAGDYAYVGSRIDGEPHSDTGILIVHIADPSNPRVVGQIGPPDEALRGMTSRELRAVPDKNLLIVLNFVCHPILHGCTEGAVESPNLKFYDLTDGRAPALVATHVFNDRFADTTPHEFFLWRDPDDSERVLLFFSMPVGPPALQVLDISDLGNITTVATWDPHDDGGLEEPRGSDSLLHSIALTDDGGVGFISQIGSGLLLIDTSDVADGVADPQITLLHDIEARVDYSPPALPGTHSAQLIPGRDLVLLTDEIYPAPNYDGCPWGWARIVDYSNVAAPAIVGEYALAENDPAGCATFEQNNITFTAHNSTMTEHIGLISWHAGGFQVIDTSDPTNPTRLTEALPEPLPSVRVEDPAMFGSNVLTWSYPIIQDGLIYVVDIRNGLYIYRYVGPFEEEIARSAFREGNSNLN